MNIQNFEVRFLVIPKVRCGNTKIERSCYMTVTPPDRSLRTLSALLEMAIKEKHITPDYSLLGHCQCSPVESPGKALYEILKTHPHWLADPPPNDA